MNWYEFLSRAWRCSEALKYKHNFKQIHDGYYAIFSDDDDDDDDDDEDDDDDSDDDDVVVDDTDDYYYDGLTKLELLRVFRVDLHAAALHPSCTQNQEVSIPGTTGTTSPQPNYLGCDPH